ncbi:hypothetical protein [Parashewanella tropica]|uniref:hypothetical protein n=1 Tax=Parashewanella tropica TaxID=2547970 RepID=UPI001059BE79|nr:hypothetical protein [Parashewanella tropica]
MKTPEPKLLNVESKFKTDRSIYVDEIRFSDNGLDVYVNSINWQVKVNFDCIYGFRVLDEGDLGEFWSECNLTVGWCFEVTEGGWTSLENSRPHFITGKLYNPREFLIIGLNECVSILTHEPPSITDKSSYNKRFNKDNVVAPL